MRILSKRQLKELVLYSPQHVARLEKAGQFPKRVQLGPDVLPAESAVISSPCSGFGPLLTVG
ncbi:helix-turn-helix transcriptional regulator, partial [Leisingera sp. D0M16]|uniref:helix-turn-helix transcriptional regulator n=1 Tax=Leisingera coralii TaxID=3351347 RepID=UPI003B7B1A30